MKVIERWEVAATTEVVLEGESSIATYRIEAQRRIHHPDSSVPEFRAVYLKQSDSGLFEPVERPWVRESSADGAINRAVEWLTGA